MKKEEITDKIVSSRIGIPTYTCIQCLMFFLYYGLEYDLPRWVVWFPTIIGVIGFLFLIIILFIALGISIFGD